MAAATLKSDIFHPEHPLRRCSYGEGTNKSCAACEHSIVTGGIGYSCDDCNFNVHEACLNLPVSISMDKHSQHELTLTRLGASRCCDICKETSHAGVYMYCCVPCDYGVHPRCTSLLAAPPQRGGKVRAIKIGVRIVLGTLRLADLLMTGGVMSPVVDVIVTAVGTI